MFRTIRRGRLNQSFLEGNKTIMHESYFNSSWCPPFEKYVVLYEKAGMLKQNLRKMSWPSSLPWHEGGPRIDR